MKKHIALLFALCIFASSFAVSASASNSTQVNYTLESSYEVQIPSSLNLNQENSLEIHTSNVLLGDGKELVVKMDSGCMNSDSYVYLYKEGYELESRRIGCYVYTGDYGAAFPNGWTAVANSNYVIAKFKTGTTDAYTGGAMYIDPKLIQTTELGLYSGRIDFLFSVEDAPQ